MLKTGAIGASHLSIHVQVTPYADSNGMTSRGERLRHRGQENEGIRAGYCLQRGCVRLESVLQYIDFLLLHCPKEDAIGLSIPKWYP